MIYTVRAEYNRNTTSCKDYVVDERSLLQIINLLESNENITSYTVWQAGCVGPMDMKELGYGNCFKWTDPKLWLLGLPENDKMVKALKRGGYFDNKR